MRATVRRSCRAWRGRTSFSIKLRAREGMEERMVAEPVLKLFREKLPDNPFTVESVSEIGPAIGHKLRQDATWALGISFLAIIIYLGWRFEFKFGVTATVATFHDIFAMVGIFWALGPRAGPSLHHRAADDRRVLADRHGGHLRPDPGEHPAPQEGHLLRDDQPERQRGAEPLPRDLASRCSSRCWPCCSSAGTCCATSPSRSVIGIVVGSYSSVFVAGPMLVLWRGEKMSEVKR